MSKHDKRFGPTNAVYTSQYCEENVYLVRVRRGERLFGRYCEENAYLVRVEGPQPRLRIDVSTASP